VNEAYLFLGIDRKFCEMTEKN